MGKTNREVKNREESLLRIRSEAALPSHKIEVHLDDLDREILEMHQKNVFFPYTELADKWEVADATIRRGLFVTQEAVELLKKTDWEIVEAVGPTHV